MPKITEFDIIIIILHQQGHSQREISKQTVYSRCGIQAVKKNVEESREVKDKDKKGLEGQDNFQKPDEKFLRVSSERPEEVQQGPGSAFGSFIRMPSWPFYSPKKLDQEWSLWKGQQPRSHFFGKGTGWTG